MGVDGVQLRLGDILFAVKKRWKTILFLSIAGLILGIIVSAVYYLQGNISQDYEIRSSVITSSIQNDGKYVYGNNYPGMDDVRYATEITDEAAYMLRSLHVIEGAINNMELIGVDASDVRNSLSANRVDETQIIELKLAWRSPEEGIELLESIIDSANTAIFDSMHAGKLFVVTAPYSKQVSGNTPEIPIWGYLFAFGIFLGFALVISELIIRPTLINLKDVKALFGLETLGVIPYDGDYFKEKRFLPDTERVPKSVFQNYSASAYIIKNRLDSRREKCFYITSSESGEGKTTVAANLALNFSEMEKRVLLVDLDVKSPGISNLFFEKTDYAKSLNAHYKGDIDIDEAIISVTGRLDLLPLVLESTPIPIDSIVIETIKALIDKYDYVVIDAPAIGESSDALSLSQLTNFAIFIIRYDKVVLKVISDSLDKVQKSGAYIDGCIVNADMSIHRSAAKNPKNVNSSSKKKHEEKSVIKTSEQNQGVEKTKKTKDFSSYSNLQETESDSDDVTDKDMMDAIIKYGFEGGEDTNES